MPDLLRRERRRDGGPLRYLGILGRLFDTTEVVSRPPAQHDDAVGQ
jgi:hypothetical protein